MARRRRPAEGDRLTLLVHRAAGLGTHRGTAAHGCSHGVSNMPGVYKEVRELRARVREAKAAVAEARALLRTWRDSCEDFLQAHANMMKLRASQSAGRREPVPKAALEDKRRVETILAEVTKLEAELADALR